MLTDILNFQKNGNSVEEFLTSVRQGLPMAVFNVCESFKSYLASTVKTPVLYVTRDIVSARRVAKMISEFSCLETSVLPPIADLLSTFTAEGNDSVYERISATDKLLNGVITVAPLEALFQPFPTFIENVNVEKGKDYDIYKLVKELIRLGYQRADTVESKGTFSSKGDILDFWSIDESFPFRADFFGDTLESIKTYNPETGKTVEYKETARVIQACPFIFSEEDYKNFTTLIEKEKPCFTKSSENFNNLKQEFYERKEKGNLNSLYYLAPISKNTGYIFDVLKQNTLIILDEAKALYGLAELLTTEFFERFKMKSSYGDAFSFSEKAMLSRQDFSEKLKEFTLADFSAITTSNGFFKPLKIFSPKVSAVPDYAYRLKDLTDDVKSFYKSGYNVYVFSGDEQGAEKLYFALRQEDIPCEINYNAVSPVNILAKNLSSGFIFHEEKCVLIGSGNVYVKRRVAKKRASRATFFSAPSAGDYAVHETHGLGRVLGNKKITSTEGTKDYVAVEYLGGDILYVPVEQMDILSRYLGSGKPALSRLGGDFSAVKKRVRESIRKMSFDLKNLYDERNSLSGFSFTEDEELKTLFESGFPYEYTEDQAIAIEEVLSDMKSSSVMDRLICGDVGFGKTEVAFRAVFLAVSNGKQAVLLAPTTILSEQHFKTATERFKDFGIKIALLNRFKSEKEEKQILKDIQDKKIDFVIGTHKLLSKKIKFNDLGLLVLDEEQRFGVEHKEKIKLLKKNVDTLTLSATPIPRTLHMSLSGIRQISIINTPPKKRIPVQTYVVEESDSLIIDAVKREVNRKGQVFILYNRVDSIFSFSEKVKALLKDVKITTLHGRMEEKTFERGIAEFYAGESDVLISTTIIENGIDLPRANTLIVIDADRLGLSTLYQLKGRVGRSDRLAYAYFTYRRDKMLTEGAYDRLSAIIEFTEMGSGIKIAMRDLEIRGAGNVLGKEQHGHIEKIGYELYSKLLREELYGDEKELELDVRVSAFIPETYVESNSVRMDIYKEIAETLSVEKEKEIKEMLISSYGKLPIETENLIQISAIKRMAKEFNVSLVTVSKSSTSLSFNALKDLSDERLIKTLEKFNGRAFISVSKGTRIEFKFDKNATGEEKLKIVRTFLEHALAL